MSTAQQTVAGHDPAHQGAVFAKTLEGIGRAGGMHAAAVSVGFREDSPKEVYLWARGGGAATSASTWSSAGRGVWARAVRDEGATIEEVIRVTQI